MYYMGIFRKTLLLWLLMGIYGLVHPHNTGAFSGKNVFPEGIKPDDLVYIEITARVKKINIHEAYLIVGDKKFYVANITRNGKRYKTRLMDQEGGEVQLDFFRKGRMVFVAGFTVPDGRNAAFVIKQLSANEEARVKKGLGCDSSKLMRRLRDSLDEKERLIYDLLKSKRYAHDRPRRKPR